MPAPLLPSLRVLLHCVNANPVGEYAPGELLVVGDYELKARRPGWNLIRSDADGRYYPVRDAAGSPPYPVATFDVPTLDGYRVDRGEWAEAAVPRVVVVPGGWSFDPDGEICPDGPADLRSSPSNLPPVWPRGGEPVTTRRVTARTRTSSTRRPTCR